MSLDTLGARILHKSLVRPFVKILENIGYEGVEAFYIAEKVSNKDPWESYNYKTKEIENFLDLGVIDPTMVSRNAIENAISVASTFLTTEVVGIQEED